MTDGTHAAILTEPQGRQLRTRTLACQRCGHNHRDRDYAIRTVLDVLPPSRPLHWLSIATARAI